MIESTLVQRVVWNVARVSPALFLRWYWSRERLAKSVQIELRARHEPVTIDLGPTSTFSVWFEVENKSPFTVVLDRLSLKLNVGAAMDGYVLDRHELKAGQKVSNLVCRGSIAGETAGYVAKHVAANERIFTYLEIRAELNCSVRDFAKAVTLDGITPTFSNLTYRVDKNLAAP